MHLKCALERARARLREPEPAHLALAHQLGHGADGVFDRHLGVDAVQVIEVDVVDAEVPQARLAGLRHVLGPAVVALAPVGQVEIAELRGEDGLTAPALQRPAEKVLVAAFHVAVGGVEEGDAEIERALHRLELDLVVAAAEMGRGAARAQADRRHGRPARAELAVLHQSALMPAAWMIGVQRASSDLTQAVSSSGVEGEEATPCLRKISWVSGARRIPTMSLFIFATSGLGMPAGANRPNHSFASMPGMPASAALWMSGAPGKRVVLDTASARTLPDLS